MWPDLAVDPKSKGGREGEREEHDEHEEHDELTHAHQPDTIDTYPVARWTTPIESTRKRHAVEFRAERLVREMNLGVGERVGSTRISHNQIQSSNKGSLDTKGMKP